MIKNISFSFAIILLWTTGSLVAQTVPSSEKSQPQQKRGQRLFQPEDLFRLWEIRESKWSPDGRFAAIEIRRPGQTIDSSVPTGEIRVLDAGTRAFRTISSPSPAYIGFFNQIWSPDSRHLAFLSVDVNGFIQPWVWTVGAKTPRMFKGFNVRTGIEDNTIAWVGNKQLAIVSWENAAENGGRIYFRITRGRKIAEGFRRAAEMKSSTASVLESGGSPKETPLPAELVMLDVSSGKRKTLARGGIHRLTASPDGRFIEFLRESSGIPNPPVSSYLAYKTDDDAFDALNWGTERHVINVQTGSEADPSAMNVSTAPVEEKPKVDIPLPEPGARRLPVAPANDAALFLKNDSNGSRLLVAGGGGRPLTDSSEIWRANEWVSEIKTGNIEMISYTSLEGKPLTAWLLLPPDYSPGTKIPIVTDVYPGRVFGTKAPPVTFSLFYTWFEHPQLFAALGYGVLMPSMPEEKNTEEFRSFKNLQNGILPAVDAVIERGIADPDRIVLEGHSNGGYTVLGMITQTNRFRSAIASAGYSNAVSHYGTFFAPQRYGDQGLPQQTGIVQRVVQFEKGDPGLGGPPWELAARYQERSAIFQADKVVTPLMLVHGDLDYVPIQQSEEFFTALYRQNKRAAFVRYQGEWHLIVNRPNVLDLWQRINAWLKETTAPRR